MKKVAVTVAVLALGLAACQKNAENAAATETAVENNAEYDVNAATANADEALNAASNDVNAVSNAASNATTNQ